MGILEELQNEMKAVEAESSHDGYWYNVSDALLVLVCGLLCGLRRVVDIHDWATSAPTKSFLAKQFGIEKVFCLAQFYNILKLVDAEKFKDSFARWMKFVLSDGVKGRTVAIDGKTICGTEKLSEDGSVLHIASAIVSELNLVIGTLECNTKMGEITAFRELIAMLDVEGAVVVADALHCNPKSAIAVIEARADYLFVVKDNQKNLKEEIEFYFKTHNAASHTTKEKNGGRVETRTAYTSHDIDWLFDKQKWPNLSCIGAIHRQFEKGGTKSNEWHFYISSTMLTPVALLTHARLEWAVESLHWLLDVHYTEDKTRIWDTNVQKLLNTARKIALNLIRIYKEANRTKSTPLSRVMRENLFDQDRLKSFLDYFVNWDFMELE